jgi:hypothetical protein
VYVRRKRIKGRIYYYLVKSERRGKKVTQKFIRYVGRAGGTDLAPFAQEARKYASAEKFVRSIPKTRQFGFAGAREIITTIPLKDFDQRIRSTPEYRDDRVTATPGRQVKNPLTVIVEDIGNIQQSRFDILDGWHRFRQALANGDSEIPVRVMVSEEQLTDFYNRAAKGIPADLRLVAQEARQFESAEKFAFQVEYHGTSSVEAADSIRTIGFIVGPGQAGVSTTQDYEEAMDYAEHDPDRVVSVFVKKDAPTAGVAGKDFITGTGSFYPESLIPLPKGFSPIKFYKQTVRGNTARLKGKTGVQKRGSLTERAPTGLEALAREARKYKSAEKFLTQMQEGIVLDDRSLPDTLRSPMADLAEARRSGTFQGIMRAKELVEENVAAINRELKGKPFAPHYRLNDAGHVVFKAVDITTMPKGLYEPAIFGKRASAIQPREAKEFISKTEEQIRQRTIDPLIGEERIQLLEEIRSGQTLTDFFYQVREKMNEG